MTPLEAYRMYSAAVEALSADPDENCPTSEEIFDWIQDMYPDQYRGFVDGCLFALMHHQMRLAGAVAEKRSE